jgi:hypothetical protein
MSVIPQLKLPYELQEFDQRKKKRQLTRQLNCCDRIYWKDTGLYYDYFYYKIEHWGIYNFEPNIFYITQEIQIMSTIFCKHCHNYVTSDGPIPNCIVCECAPAWLNVD